ncbi:flagellar basal body rod protein FlgC [Zooshikella sp. RANM57]|uniref:flagellar basal body rod protein FlgC n=1 Tax=Zooshikella sp. RANM57 TaxID=3425863 RepID=UPI003D6F4A36
MDSFSLSEVGMSLQKQQLNLIAQNIAHANTVAKPGESYRALELVVSNPSQPLNIGPAQIKEIKAQPIRTFDPNHPLANRDGFIERPNINMADQMMKMMMATRAYEANLSVFNASKKMAQLVLER